MKQNDSPEIQHTFRGPDNDVLDLSSNGPFDEPDTIRLYVRTEDDDLVVNSSNVTVEDANAGVISYDLEQDDTGIIGTYNLEWEADFGTVDGRTLVLTSPPTGYQKIQVEEKLGTVNASTISQSTLTGPVDADKNSITNLEQIQFSDSNSDPDEEGEIQRNGSDLRAFLGGQVQSLLGGSGTGGLTEEQVEDVVGGLIAGGADIDVTYDDANDTLTIDYAGSAGGRSQEEIEDFVAGVIEGGTDINVTYDDANNRILIAFSGESYSAEKARDDVGAALTGGTDIDVTVSDANDTITIDFTGTGQGKTEEEIEDIVNGLLVGGSDISTTYDDVNNTLTIDYTGGSTSSSGGGGGDGIQRFAEELDASGGESPIRRWAVEVDPNETVELQRAFVGIWDSNGSFTTDAGVKLNWHEAGSNDVEVDDAGTLDIKTGDPLETWTNTGSSTQFGWIEIENTTANPVMAWGAFKIVNQSETGGSTTTSTNTFSELNVDFTDDSSSWVYDSTYHADQGSTFTIYCDPNGSSTADGLTQANAVTLERAFELVPRHGIDDVTLDLATVPSLPVTYDNGRQGFFPPAIYPLTTPMQLNIRGDTTTPSNVKITPKFNVFTGVHKGDHYRIEGVEMENGMQFNGKGIVQDCNIFDAGTRGVSNGIIGAKQAQDLILDGVTLGDGNNDEETLFNWTHGNSTVLMQQVDMTNDGSVPTACGKQNAEVHVRDGGVTLNGTGINENMTTAQMNHFCNSGVELHFETGQVFRGDKDGNGRWFPGSEITNTTSI